MDAPAPHPSRRIIVGITGASGAAYAQRSVELLLLAGIETHVVITPLGQRLLHDELDMRGIDAVMLAGTAAVDVDDFPQPPPHLHLHPYRDVGASIASGSFQHDGMVIVPCSSNTLSAVAMGSAQNLLHRAAHVTLKERRRLILVHREAPLSLIDIRNMEAATLAGAIILPANPGFYLRPRSVNELVDFVVARALDLLGVEHGLDVRWGEGLNRQDANDAKGREEEADEPSV